MFDPLSGYVNFSGGGSGENIRYTVVKALNSNGAVEYKLRETIDGNSKIVGEIISFSAKDIEYIKDNMVNVEEALDNLFAKVDKYCIYTFEELEIDTQGLTTTEVLSELKQKNLPKNSTVTGKFYNVLAAGNNIEEGNVEVKITTDSTNKNIYWITLTSSENAPYSWDGIWSDDDVILNWTPSRSQGGGSGIIRIEYLKVNEDDVPAQSGQTDTYKIFYENGEVGSFQVYNGKDGEKVRYSIEKVEEDGIVKYKLMQTIGEGEAEFVGDEIIFDSVDMVYDAAAGISVKEAIDNKTNKFYEGGTPYKAGQLIWLNPGELYQVVEDYTSATAATDEEALETDLANGKIKPASASADIDRISDEDLDELFNFRGK